MSDQSDQTVSNAAQQLIQQLSSNAITTIPAAPFPLVTLNPSVSSENLEEFVLQKSANLVENTLKLVNDIRSYVISSPTPDDVSAVAALISSSAAALEVMNKILITDKNLKAKEKIKQMDIDSKKAMQNDELRTKVMLSREQVLEQLVRTVGPTSSSINVEATVIE